MIYLIIGSVILWAIITYSIFRDGYDGAFSGSFLIFMLLVMINGCSFAVKDKIDTSNCSEISQRIIPKIVHVSDSSVKILKWNDYQTTIEKTDPLFFVPESILRIDTCTGNVEVK